MLQTIKPLRELGSGHTKLRKVVFVGFSKHKCDVLESQASTQLDHASFRHVLGPVYVRQIIIILQVVFNLEIFSTNFFIQSKMLRIHKIIYP